MNFANEYKEKLIDANEAVKVIKSGDWIDYSPLIKVREPGHSVREHRSYTTG